MKQFEFETEVGEEAIISIPSECAKEIPTGQPLRVVLLVPEIGDNEIWANLAAKQFAQGYADSDAIYDQLSEE